MGYSTKGSKLQHHLLHSTFSQQLQVVFEMKIVFVFMVGFVWVNVQGQETGGCTWAYTPKDWGPPKPIVTDVDNQLMCADGTTCNGGLDLVTNWDCCKTRGGRARCPQNYPVMCHVKVQGTCGDDYCCEKAGTVLGNGETCQLRACPAP